MHCTTFKRHHIYLHGRQSEGKSEVGVTPLTKFSTVFHTLHTHHIYTRLEPWATKKFHVVCLMARQYENTHLDEITTPLHREKLEA